MVIHICLLRGLVVYFSFSSLSQLMAVRIYSPKFWRSENKSLSNIHCSVANILHNSRLSLLQHSTLLQLGILLCLNGFIWAFIWQRNKIRKIGFYIFLYKCHIRFFFFLISCNYFESYLMHAHCSIFAGDVLLPRSPY